MASQASQIKCGYCGWFLAYQCGNILDHACFKDYNEKTDVINIDENNVAIIVSKLDDESSVSPQNIDFDEQLIMAVINRPPLYDHRLDVKERSKTKKTALWEEIQNTIGSNISIKELQKKWKYHRDCYIRARKKLKSYVPSGSSSASSANFKSNYKFFELMRPLDDTFQTTPTISTLTTPEKSFSEDKEKENNGCNNDYSLSDVESEIYSETSTSFQSSDLASLPSTSTSSAKRRKKNDESQQLQTALLDILKMPVTEIDAVDGFLKSLGEALRRLPYEKRVMLQIKFLQMTTTAEFEQ